MRASLCFVVLVVALYVCSVVAIRPSPSHVLSEVGSSTKAIPGEQCFSSNHGLPENGEETQMLYSYQSFCEQVVADLADPYEKESEFREACMEKYGEDVCKQQCRQLAQLFDQTVIGLAVSGDKYGLSHGNAAGYTIQQSDCEYCLRLHQCTPKRSVA